ncbi:hypothetical protein [Ancylobacter sp. FA202]|uniref:hypothetical protein n=1 Tax=Ancylobacter sp. FA202 TaxID=1111106 RepID=UPI000377350B|nr:hypothetical protein [Ancylobacter sp. FA202]
MKKETFRIVIGTAVILVHAMCFFVIIFLKGDYLTEEQRMSMTLILMPITSAYIMAIIKNAVDKSTQAADETVVNLNYAVIVTTFTLVALLGLLWLVVSLEGAQEADKQRILIFEIVFGAGFGLIASDLFGKVERVAAGEPIRRSEGSGEPPSRPSD